MPAPVSNTATALGFGAILLWASLASLTALKGPIPPFQTTAMVFALGALVGVLVAAARGRLACLRPTAASLTLGVYDLFGFHALYFAALKLAPPAEASLVASLWALLTVLLSGLLPGQGLRWRHVIGALIGATAAVILVWDKLDVSLGLPGSRLGFALALGCAVVWATYSVGLRLLAGVPSESIAVSCLATAALALVCSLLFEQWAVPAGGTQWLALLGLGTGPVGAAFLLWDVGMKGGNLPLLGVLAYASPVISTGLLVALGFAEAAWTLGAACVLMVIAAVIATR
jgi:drug/metabolite transporter (DMT)-like permease